MNKKKYMWSDSKFDNYAKMEAKKLERLGFKQVSTATITRLLYDKVIIPNDISMDKMFVKELKLKKRRGKLII